MYTNLIIDTIFAGLTMETENEVWADKNQINIMINGKQVKITVKKVA